MKTNSLFLFGVVILFFSCERFSTYGDSQKTVESMRPKLVVGIVVDQMRSEYLYRYYDKFSDGGFKRLMQDGYNMKNVKYQYIPTFTAPGHASIYTGTTPSNHGIIANNWWDYDSKSSVYCAYDEDFETVGSGSERGKFSPLNLLSSTITDELRIASLFKSKVIGISIKDRGAIYPAGRAANAAYWYDENNGKFITSNYYMEEIPEWVKTFYQQNKVEKYLNGKWETLYDLSSYKESTADSTSYEDGLAGTDQPEFPYDLQKLKETYGYALLADTPFGNSYVADFAIAAIDGEEMGMGDHTDFLAVSFSSTDYIGHRYGPQSIEVEDTYLRLDRDIERLLNHMDSRFGPNQCLLFLTADHGAVYVPGFLRDHKLSADNLKEQYFIDLVKKFCEEKWGSSDILQAVMNENVYLDRSLIKRKNLDLMQVRKEIARKLLEDHHVVKTLIFDDLAFSEFNSGQAKLLQNGFHANRSGDVVFITKPAFLISESHFENGSSHGTGYTYDTHVPLLWYGWGIPAGESVIPHGVTDIAPTLSMMLNIPLPNASTGEPIEELF